MVKQCFKCQRTKHIDYFYRHPDMSDGYLNKCKDCTKKDTRRRYYDPEARDRIIEYEKKRSLDPDRRRKRIQYQRANRRRYPGKYKARQKVNNLLRSGDLKREPCEVCGYQITEAHHIDYRKPLLIKWLCREHHLEIENKQSWKC